MADRRIASSRDRNLKSSTGRSNPGQQESRQSTGISDLLSREEEYKRMNDELEQHTATLLEEAEAVMRTQQETLARPSLLDNINADDFLGELDTNRTTDSPVFPDEAPYTESRAGSRAVRSRPESANLSSASRQRSAFRNNADDEEDTFMTQFRQMTFEKSVTNVTEQGNASPDLSEHGANTTIETESVIPSTAEDMGVEAQHRFLKAKLRVMQQELERLSEDCAKKDELATKLQTRLRDAEEERGRLQRANSAHSQQLTKLERNAEELRGKAAALETEKTNLRKELEAIKRSQKQDVTSHNATEVRLNRALEEQSKLRQQLAQVKSAAKDDGSVDKRRVEQLLAENRRLEKQKQELMTGLKKSLRLNHVLKQQRMHIEAAKMLEFTEEEFVKVLEWGN